MLRAVPVVLLFVLAAPVHAQDTTAVADTVVVAEDPPTTRDVRLLRAIYDAEAPAFVAAMGAAQWSSHKVYVGAAPAHWLGLLAFDDAGDYRPAYLMTLTQVGSIGTVFALKNIVRRPRPYASLPDVTSRSRNHPSTFDPYSFPSGHAALSFALATSISLSYPAWYVVAPSFLWATAVALSRSWLGVHYPTDTALGAALGAGIAVGVHALGDAITPAFLRGDEAEPPPPAVRLFFRF